MRRYICSIDPGNHSGITHGWEDETPVILLRDFTPKKANKSRKAEQEHERYGKLWMALNDIVEPILFDAQEVIIICEAAAGFTKGKSAVEVSNQYRGVVKSYACVNNCRFINIQPNDLQRFATGKGRAEKTEMIEVATKRYGFTGKDDNEADSLILWHFAKKHAG